MRDATRLSRKLSCLLVPCLLVNYKSFISETILSTRTSLTCFLKSSEVMRSGLTKTISEPHSAGCSSLIVVYTEHGGLTCDKHLLALACYVDTCCGILHALTVEVVEDI